MTNKEKIIEELIKQLKEQRESATNIGIDVDASIGVLADLFKKTEKNC